MPTITIVFRGLMVFSNQPHGMEIGLVDTRYTCRNGHSHSDDMASNGHSHSRPMATAATDPALLDPFEDAMESPPVHVPRILTVKNGVLTSILDLRTRPELGTVRNWQLVVTDPLQSDVTTYQTPGTFFDRRTHPNDRDFRWITDMEAPDLHGRLLTHDINTRQLLMVLYVRQGEFYTKVKSPPLRVTGPDAESYYGCNAAVVGCDIEFEEGGSVKLVAGGRTGVEVFEFAPDANTVYEISNGPPDVPPDEPVPLDGPGHFHLYYDMLFNPPYDRFDLTMEDRAPAPDPILCGVVYLSQREDPL